MYGIHAITFALYLRGYRPRLAVIVVKKRINTRFMLPGRSMTNPPPGTCVDQVVTRKEWYVNAYTINAISCGDKLLQGK